MKKENDKELNDLKELIDSGFYDSIMPLELTKDEIKNMLSKDSEEVIQKKD